MRVRGLIPVLVLTTGLLVAGISKSETPAAGDLRAFEGHWTRTTRDADDAARSASIDALTAALPVWYRALARTMMKASMQPDEQYRIRTAAWGLAVEVDAQQTRELRVLEPPASQAARPRSRFVGDAIEHEWRHSETSYGTTTWRLLDDGRLRIEVEAFDDRMRGEDDQPLPIRYATNYSRAALATSAGPPE